MKLILSIKKQWFDKISCLQKQEEYRELNTYYLRRLFYSNSFKLTDEICQQIIFDLSNNNDLQKTLNKWDLKLKINKIEFRNGYGKRVPSFIIVLKDVKIGAGEESLGAEVGKQYFILKLSNSIEWINPTNEIIQYQNEANEQCNHYDTSESSDGYEVCNVCGAYLQELGVEL